MNAQILRMIEMATRPLKNRIMMAIARGVLETVKDDQGIQTGNEDHHAHHL